MIEFIKANKSDCKQLSIIKHKIWESTYRGIYENKEIDDYDYIEHQRKFENKIVSKESLYCIKENEEIIGYFSYGNPKYNYKDFKLSLNALYILPKCQNKGIGRKVFNHLNDYCKNKKIDKFFTCCNMYNFKALEFYKKMKGNISYYEASEKDRAKHQYYIEFEV